MYTLPSVSFLWLSFPSPSVPDPDPFSSFAPCVYFSELCSWASYEKERGRKGTTEAVEIEHSFNLTTVHIFTGVCRVNTVCHRPRGTFLYRSM